MLQSLSQDGEYFFLKPLGIAFFPAIFNVFVNLLWASLIFSLFGQSKWFARSSVIFFYSGQSAFWKFHRARGVPVENEKRRGVWIRERRCWDRGKRSSTSLVGVTPLTSVQNVTSGFVPVCHLPDSKVAGCLGS